MSTTTELRMAGGGHAVRVSNGVPAPLSVIAAAGANQTVEHGLARRFGPTACVYASLDLFGEDEVDLQRRQIAGSLRHDGASDQVIDAVAARVAAHRHAPGAVAVFAADDGQVLHEQWLRGATGSDIVDFTTPVRLLPLLDWSQDRPPYVLVVIDRSGADLTTSAGGDQPAQVTTVEGFDDEIERNAPGGWSQPRYQQRAEDSWRHNAAQVAGAVEKSAASVGAQVLILAGDVRAVQLLTAQLPITPGTLVYRIAGSRTGDGSQADRAHQVDEVLRDAAQSQTRRLLDRFQEQLSPGGLAVAGSADTIAALTAGRVETLLISDATSPGLQVEVWFAATHEIYPDGAAALTSPGPVRIGQLRDVAVRSALLSGARVRIVEHDIPSGPDGGIGALCRFRES